MSVFFLVLGLFLLSFTGIGLYFFHRISDSIIHTLIALGAGTMFAVALVHILPESLELVSASLYSFVGGFLAIYILEEVLTTHNHDRKHQDHIHEDPHEHMRHVALVAWIAISIHTLFDGLIISAGMQLGEVVGMSILFGVALHQIPVSFSVASILKESSFSSRIQFSLLLIFALAAPIGYLITSGFIQVISPSLIGHLSAFAGGSLLYVSTVELLPIVHSQSTKNMKYVTLCVFIFGVVGMSVIKIFE